MDLFELQQDLHKSDEQREGRYYGFMRGSITNVNDDQSLVRVKARLGAQGDGEESDWLVPAFPGSMECKPTKGDPCIVGFVDGNPQEGFWLYHPKSTTKGRPQEAVPLGTTSWGMINFLVDQVNQLRTDFNTFVTTIYNTHNHATAPLGPVSVPSVVGTGTTAAAANKGKASDGSIVANKATSEIVLSGLVKVK